MKKYITRYNPTLDSHNKSVMVEDICGYYVSVWEYHKLFKKYENLKKNLRSNLTPSSKHIEYKND